jgi:Amt family ammonium transporter
VKEKIAKVSLIAMWVAIATAAPLRIAVADEAAPATAPAAAAASTLPAYFSGANADPAKPTWPDPTGAASGVWATPAGDGKGDVPSSLSIPDLYDRIAHNLVSINFVWALVTGFLVMFMQAGFMLVETGLCRSKNAAHTAAMNFMIYPLGCLAFWAYGFAIGWGLAIILVLGTSWLFQSWLN